MRCPSCHVQDTRVIDTRVIEDGTVIRRRRDCEKCGFRFSTTEEVEILTLMVVKANESEEPYDRDKLMHGLKIALQKRLDSPAKFKRLVHAIEQDIQRKAKRDTIPSVDIGEIVIKHLKKVDTVAYIRFASVYRSFENVEAFADELERLSPRILTSKKRKKA